jgi:hypothetical protein
MLLKAPCQDCSDRHLGCHGTCNKYILYKHKQKLLKEQEVRDKISMARTSGPRNTRRSRTK